MRYTKKHFPMFISLQNVIYECVLHRMSCVSHSWKNAVRNDKVSHERRLHYLEVYAQNKVHVHVNPFYRGISISFLLHCHY